MPFKVELTDIAARDLNEIRLWLTQPGSGQRAQATATRLARAVKGRAETALRHPPDRFVASNRQLVVERHVLSYRIVDGDFVSVERIYGPGEGRP